MVYYVCPLVGFLEDTAKKKKPINSYLCKLLFVLFLLQGKYNNKKN